MNVNACERYLTAINERVDGTLGPIRRAELELHLESCDACRALAEDLQAIAEAAESLAPLAPPPHVWTRISSQLQAEGRVSPTATGILRQNRTWLALAATLALAVGASLVAIFPRGGAAPTPIAAGEGHQDDGNAAADDPVKSMTTELALSDQHLQKALDEVTKSGEVLDPKTTAVLREELEKMNAAGDNIRKALETDPQDAVARRSLYDLLKQKVRFIQDTIALMNEMRQGDAAGAAQIVEGGKS